MKIEGFLKNEFRDKVKFLAGGNEVKFNLNFRGEPKKIVINGIQYDDCIAYYKERHEGDFDKNSTYYVGFRPGFEKAIYFIYKPILYSDLLKVERILKINKIEGNDINIKTKRKARVKVEPKFELEIGKSYRLKSTYDFSRMIIIDSKTAKGWYKYHSVNSINGEEISGYLKTDKYGDWVDKIYYLK